jgi:hypothetical protein
MISGMAGNLNKNDFLRLSTIQGDCVPFVSNMVMLTNHIELFSINEIDADGRTANVARLRSNFRLKRIPWSTNWHCDEPFLRTFAARLRSIF